MGDLVPSCVMECVPGDKFTISTDALFRLAPMIAPMMHRVDVYHHYFFVPNRLVWDGWKDFITGGQDPSNAPAAPYMGTFTNAEGSLADYMGLPIGNLDNNARISALPFAAYQMIYNEYYRDQNLIAPVAHKLANGSNTASTYNIIRKRAWQHDYFTSALPWAQKGSAVDIPLGSVELVDDWNTATGINPQFKSPQGQATGTIGYNVGTSRITNTNDGAGANPQFLDPNGSLEVEATTINSLRRAFKLQEWLEKNARGGSRYIESILSHFGVKSSDARLQRPEYLGGMRQNMVISEVLQTGESNETPQGNMAGHGVSANSGKPFSYFCEEHGYIIGIISIMPKTAYQQGIPRHFSKMDRMLYFWPEFANIGEQEIKNQELYYNAADGQPVNDATFGYVPRYAEYKYQDNRVAGEFRSSLDFWHMGRKFASRPALNGNFVTADPTTRIFAVTDPAPDKVYCQVVNKIFARRLMPKYGTPMI